MTAPAEVAQGHRKVWIEFNGLLPAGHCLCRLLLIPKVAEVVPCHDCVRIVLYCLFKRLHGFETEREYIVHIPCLGCGEPFCGRILVAVSIREPAQPVFHCRIRFYALRIFKNGLSIGFETIVKIVKSKFKIGFAHTAQEFGKLGFAD